MADDTLELLKKAYEYLDDVTPLEADCGNFCNRKCCKGTDKDGMLLFPEEEKLFENKAGFKVYFDSRYNCCAVSCEGKCNRTERPLSCRIFPYLIYKKKSCKPTVAPDIRAVDFCPVLKENISSNKRFLRALRITAILIAQDDDICQFLENLTALMTDFNNL